MDEMNNPRRSRKSRNKARTNRLMLIIIACVIAFLGVAAGFTVYHYNEIKYWDKLIYPGVTVENLDLSGKTKAEAKNMINKAYVEKLKNKKIIISASDSTYTLNYSNINGKFNVDDIVNQAYSYGKNSNILKKYSMIKSSNKVIYKLKFTYDEKPVKELVKKIAGDVDRDPENAAISMGGIGFNITPEVNGLKLDQKDLEKQLLSKIDGDVTGDLKINAKIDTVAASIKSSDLQKVNTLISNFSTNYGSVSSSERANNIELATKSINGTVIMPGEEFSFNGVVGERTAVKGYKAAPVIIGDKLEDGLGGGICQVSTTLYNAVNAAGLTSTERVHHTMPVHYVAKGMDATVDYGNIDYKFRNDFKYPVYVQGYTSGGSVVFNIYSNSAEKK
ncbi:VanW family protein [Clostridium tyrobutyricum]|uniref:VanW family protein n=1 Tax=Clostridium tyrobutyricum TaxID=1519 RepID=UPI00073D2695|nr:VanW family protein [Clostridium tyrobutyricum]